MGGGVLGGEAVVGGEVVFLTTYKKCDEPTVNTMVAIGKANRNFLVLITVTFTRIECFL